MVAVDSINDFIFGRFFVIIDFDILLDKWLVDSKSDLKK